MVSQWRSAAEIGVTVILVSCAVLVTGLVVRRELRADSRVIAKAVKVDDWRRYARGRMTIGAESASVTITVFSDYQCPFCRELHQTLTRLMQRRADVRLVYRSLPIQSIHPYARSAALGAECAAKGGRFREYHDYLFQNQDSLGRAAWSRIAAYAGVADTSAFNECFESPQTTRLLESDSIDARSLRIAGTPAMLVNRWLVSGALTQDSVETLIAKALSETGKRL